MCFGQNDRFFFLRVLNLLLFIFYRPALRLPRLIPQTRGFPGSQRAWTSRLIKNISSLRSPSSTTRPPRAPQEARGRDHHSLGGLHSRRFLETTFILANDREAHRRPGEGLAGAGLQRTRRAPSPLSSTSLQIPSTSTQPPRASTTGVGGSVPPLRANPPRPLLAPSWDKKNKKTRFILMLPQLARTVLAEFDSMDKQLQATVTALPLEAVTKPSPTKALLKKRDRTSCEKIEELTGAVASLEAKNTTLQGALRDEV